MKRWGLWGADGFLLSREKFQGRDLRLGFPSLTAALRFGYNHEIKDRSAREFEPNADERAVGI